MNSAWDSMCARLSSSWPVAITRSTGTFSTRVIPKCSWNGKKKTTYVRVGSNEIGGWFDRRSDRREERSSACRVRTDRSAGRIGSGVQTAREIHGTREGRLCTCGSNKTRARFGVKRAHTHTRAREWFTNTAAAAATTPSFFCELFYNNITYITILLL